MQSSLTIFKNTPLFYIAFGLLAQLDCLCNLSGYLFMKPIYFIPDGSRLSFVMLSDKQDGNNKMALYKCECGIEKEIRASHVKSGRVRSCGCLVGDTMRAKIMSPQERIKRSLSQQTHGLSKHPIYHIYHDIIRRCEDETRKVYPNYGGRGVYMCYEWRNDFMLFYDWVLDKGWRKGLHVDKDIIPKRLGIPAIVYSPEMCSIVSTKENMNAIATNVNVEYLGRTQTLSQWAEEFQIDYKLFWSRINRGWNFERAAQKHKVTTKESGEPQRTILLNTQTGIFYFGFKEAAESIGMSANALYYKVSERRKAQNTTPFILG